MSFLRCLVWKYNYEWNVNECIHVSVRIMFVSLWVSVAVGGDSTLHMHTSLFTFFTSYAYSLTDRIDCPSIARVGLTDSEGCLTGRYHWDAERSRLGWPRCAHLDLWTSWEPPDRFWNLGKYNSQAIHFSHTSQTIHCKKDIRCYQQTVV